MENQTLPLEFESKYVVELINSLKCLNINGKLIVYGTPQEIEKALLEVISHIPPSCAFA